MAGSRSTDAAGFSLVEIVIAIMLLGVVAIAILPLLMTGLQVSAEQATTAAATRKLNAIVEQVRANPTCDGLAAAVERETFDDGRGVELESIGVAPGTEDPPACAPGEVATVSIEVRSFKGVVAGTVALVYMSASSEP